MEPQIKFTRQSFLKRFVISQFVLAGFVICILLSASNASVRQKAKTVTENSGTKTIAAKVAVGNTGK